MDGIIGNKFLPANIRRDIIERTDGIPLFVEEMTRLCSKQETRAQSHNWLLLFRLLCWQFRRACTPR